MKLCSQNEHFRWVYSVLILGRKLPHHKFSGRERLIQTHHTRSKHIKGSKEHHTRSLTCSKFHPNLKNKQKNTSIHKMTAEVHKSTNHQVSNTSFNISYFYHNPLPCPHEQLNMHTPYICGFAWSDMVHGCMVYTELVPRWQQFHVAPALPAL